MKTLRTLALASTLGLALVGTAPAANAWSQDPAMDTWAADMTTGRSVHMEPAENPGHHHRMLHHAHRHNTIHANGYCNGRSHGTGDLSCGTATGGPVGGNASRH